MRKRITFVIGVCLFFIVSFFSGCIDVPEEFTRMSIISFNAEPNIINQGETANLSWAVMSADSVNIDNGIGSVALTGHRMIQPTQTTTYTLTASNATTTKSVTVTITVKNDLNINGDGGPTKAPNMAWNKQISPNKQLVLVSADSGLDWIDFRATFPATITAANLNGIAITNGSVLPAGNVLAGATITITGTGTFILTHVPTNTLIGTWTWT